MRCSLIVPVIGGMLLLAACAPEPTSSPSASAPTRAATSTPAPTGSASAGASPSPSTTVPAPGSTPVPSSTPEGVPVTVITAGLEAEGIEVTAIVTGETDPAGLCVLTASLAGVTRSAQVSVNPSGENSYCPLMVIPRGDLSSGTWQLSVEYRGAAGEGRSALQSVEVP